MAKPQPTPLDRHGFLQNTASKPLLLVNSLFALVYFFVITLAFKHGNQVLFYLLIVGELFHIIQIIGYAYTVWSDRLVGAFNSGFDEPVDVFITVCGEPVEIVRQTAQACKAMIYPNFNVYLLNDGLVAKKTIGKKSKR